MSPIIEDGGIWNENISELQAAVLALGGDVEVNGVISNTEILRLQRAVNTIAGYNLIADPDGDLGNDAMLTLQDAVNFLTGGGGGDRYLLEDGSGHYLLEDGSGYYILETV